MTHDDDSWSHDEDDVCVCIAWHRMCEEWIRHLSILCSMTMSHHSTRDGAYIVTGAFSGFGLAMSSSLFRQGYSVVMADIGKEMAPTNEVSSQSIHTLMQSHHRVSVEPNVNVADYDSMLRVFVNAKQKFAHIQGVVNNAGVNDRPSVFNKSPGSRDDGDGDGRVDAQMWKLTVDANLMGVIHGTSLALRFCGQGKK